MAELTRREQANIRWGALVTERSSWIDHWKEISQYLLPRSGRFFIEDRNRGEKRYNNIYDSTATRALRVLGAGMQAGMTSPASPWVKLTTLDPTMAKAKPVAIWLNDVTELMLSIFYRSNTYRALHMMYEELGAFGTACSVIDPDFNSVIWQHPLTAGQYAISTDDKGRTQTLYREFEMTVEQMIGKFGLDKVSAAVRGLYDTSRGLDQWRPVLHAIQPRVDRDYGKRDAKNMPFSSCYYEIGAETSSDGLLRESGYRMFSAIAPRWAVAGGDIYGNGPGMEALGDIKQLQHEQLRKAQGIDFMSYPPLQVAGALKNAGVDLLPGGITYVDSPGPHGGMRNAFDVQLDLSHLLNDIQDVRTRINQAFYVDLFLMLANDNRSNITAREVAERHEEKLLMLGPVLERLHDEMLGPLVEITFARMIDANIVPPPPQELQGAELKVEFVSLLAQAQRIVGLGSVDRLIGTVATLGELKPEAFDKLDTDQVIDHYADTLGVDPNLIVANDKVALIRQQRAQQQEQAAKLASIQPAADAAAKLASADTSGKNALTDIARAAGAAA